MAVYIITWSVWLLSEILLNRLLRSGPEGSGNLDKGTIRIIWITIGIANTIGIVCAVFVRFPISSYTLIPYIGLLLIICGMIIRFIAILTLGRLFTVDVTIRNDHKIVKNGIYSIIRHPSYSGSILSFIGFGISVNNWISLVIIVLPVSWAMLRRISVEEKLLTAEFGKDYTDYMKDTYRLIPWVY